MDHDEMYAPPPGPPPLLSPPDISWLCFQGWVQLDLPDALTAALSDLDTAASAFFDQDLDKKQSLYTAQRGTEYGFYQVEDEKEYITFRNRIHQDSHLEDKVAAVWQQSGRLLHRILCDIARTGGHDPSCWDPLVDQSLSFQPAETVDLDTHLTQMRLFRYYPHGGIALRHLDLGLLTLCVGNGKGLQVLDRTQSPFKFVDVDKPTVLIGNTLRVLLGDRVRAGSHQVVGNPDGRHSIVHALRPFVGHSIDMAAFGGEGVVETKELYRRIAGNRYNINAKKDVREQQQKARNQRRRRKPAVDRAVSASPEEANPAFSHEVVAQA